MREHGYRRVLEDSHIFADVQWGCSLPDGGLVLVLLEHVQLVRAVVLGEEGADVALDVARVLLLVPLELLDVGDALGAARHPLELVDPQSVADGQVLGEELVRLEGVVAAL